MFMTLVLAAATPVAPHSDARILRYQVRKDDTLNNLARRYFVSVAAIDQVVKASNLGQPRKLIENETIQIPYRVLRWQPVNGAVVSFRGMVRLGGEVASVGKRLDEGARVETAGDSFVALRFPDGTITTLPSNSRVLAVSMRRYILTGEVDRRFIVEKGASEWSVTPARSPKDRFDVRTPVATTAVRGTEFRVTYAEAGQQSGTGVVKGEVAFSTPKSDAAVPLPVGFGAVTDARGGVDKRALLEAPGLEKGYAAQRAEKVRFAAMPVKGAALYRFEIARDSSFLESVTELRAAEPLATLASLEDGNYFLRVSAYDDAGLQGKSQSFAFSRKLLLLAASPDGASGRFKFSWTKGPAGTIGYRFLMSTREDMRSKLVDTVVSNQNQLSIGPLAPGRYYWRVVTLAPEGDDPSEVQTFQLGEQ